MANAKNNQTDNANNANNGENGEQIVLTPDNIDRVVFDGITIENQMRTQCTPDDPQIEQTLVVDLTGETWDRIASWIHSDRRIALQNGYLRNPKKDYDAEWQKENSTVTIVTAEFFAGRKPSKPKSPEQRLMDKYERGEIDKPTLIKMLSEM